MTIEQKLIRDCGITEVPELATWMLADGTMANGSYEGRQRDMDHREVGQYFKPSVRQTPGDNTVYLNKFLRRGNIRISCTNFCFQAEIWAPPTPAQLKALSRIMRAADRNQIDTWIDWHTRTGKRRAGDWAAYLAYLRRYYPDLAGTIPAPIQY